MLIDRLVSVVPLAAAPVAPTLTVPATVAPLTGEVTLTAGAFLTVTEMVEVVAVGPSASVAVAVMLCVPSLKVVVSQLNVCGVLLPVLICDPSMLIDKLDSVVPLAAAPVAPTLAVPATVAPFVGEVTLTAGAFLTVTVIVDEVAVPPSASVAVAVMLCVPSLKVVVSQLNVWGELLPLFTWEPSIAIDKLVSVVPPAAVAVAVTVVVPEMVALFAGAVTATAGGVVALTTETMAVAACTAEGAVPMTGNWTGEEVSGAAGAAVRVSVDGAPASPLDGEKEPVTPV